MDTSPRSAMGRGLSRRVLMWREGGKERWIVCSVKRSVCDLLSRDGVFMWQEIGKEGGVVNAWVS